MTPASQLVFFQKVRNLFARATVGIPIQAKKKYRLNPDEVARVRNVCCLFSQVFPALATKIPEEEGARMQQDFVEGTSMDDDWYPFLDSRPKRISLSMLRSRKEEAKKMEQEKPADDSFRGGAAERSCDVSSMEFLLLRPQAGPSLAGEVESSSGSAQGKASCQVSSQKKGASDCGRESHQRLPGEGLRHTCFFLNGFMNV